MARPHKLRPPTSNAELIRKLWSEGKNCQQIANAVNRDWSTISDWLIRHGLKPHPATTWTSLPHEEIRRLAAQGKRPREIADELGLHYGNLYDWMCRHGLHKPKPWDNFWVKALRADYVPELLKTAIADLPLPRPTSREVAKVAGYSGSSIRYWLSGKRPISEQVAADLIETFRRMTEAHYAQARVRDGVPGGVHPGEGARDLQRAL